MSWQHRVIKYHGEHGDIFQICEFYSSIEGYTGEVAPVGETLEELESELESMLHAVKETISGSRAMVEEDL